MAKKHVNEPTFAFSEAVSLAVTDPAVDGKGVDVIFVCFDFHLVGEPGVAGQNKKLPLV